MANYGANEAQGKFWNDAPGQSWVKHDLVMNLRLGNISDILFDRLKGVSASNALDIGCGTGSTSIKMAETLAQDARVTGIDISEPMLERAREKAADLENVSFVTADAQAFQFEPGKFDAAISASSPATAKNLYAVNYNVLRIMSGMGGLAYSN